MGDSTCHGADGLHLLRLPQLGFAKLQRGFRLTSFGNVLNVDEIAQGVVLVIRPQIDEEDIEEGLAMPTAHEGVRIAQFVEIKDDLTANGLPAADAIFRQGG